VKRDERSLGNGTGAKLAAVAFIVLLLFVLGDYWLLQSMLWKKITMCSIDVNAAGAWDACGHQNNCPAVV